MTERVAVERRGSVAWLRLNRPEVLNALDGPLLDELAAAVAVVAGDADVRVVALTGNGTAFCAGADLRYVRTVPSTPERSASQAFLGHAQATFEALAALPKPTIAAVNGITLAGGLELVLCCDLVVAADSARIGDGHLNYGMLPGGGASSRLPRRVGASRAKQLLYTGAAHPAEVCATWGLVDQVVPAGDLEAAVDELAGTMVTKSPLGLAAVKRLVDGAADRALHEVLADEIEAVTAYERSDDFAEGLRAFSEQRAPVFRGV